MTSCSRRRKVGTWADAAKVASGRWPPECQTYFEDDEKTAGRRTGLAIAECAIENSWSLYRKSSRLVSHAGNAVQANLSSDNMLVCLEVR